MTRKTSRRRRATSAKAAPVRPGVSLVAPSLSFIESRIYLARQRKVMIDHDLAALYGVPTKALNQAVRRNAARFPDDFMVTLSLAEAKALLVKRAQDFTEAGGGSRSQSVTLKRGSNPKYRPLVFTEQGVAMLSSVLRSTRAIAVNIEIMRAFVRLRELIGQHADIARRMDELDRKFSTRTDEHREHIREIYELIEQLLASPASNKRKIGFHTLQRQG